VLVGVAAVVMLGLSLAVSVLSFGTLGWVGAIGMGLFTLVIGGLAVAFVGATTAAGFAIWYRATAGEKFTAEGFRQAVFSGFLLGTVVALGAIALVLSFVPGVSGFLGFVGSVMLATVIGAGMGGLSTTITHFVFKGGGPESVFWALVAGMAWGAAFGAVSGAIGAGSTSLASWTLSLGNTGSNVLGAIASVVGLGWDLTDSFVFPFVGSGHSVGGFCQMALSTAVGGTATLGALLFKYDTSFADSDVWDAFFRGATLNDYLDPQPLWR